jgi:WD40 repeat protein
MITLNRKRLALVLAAAMLALWSNAHDSSGQDRPAADQGRQAKKTDVHGDPLPEKALARMGTLRWRHPAIITFVSVLPNNQLITGCGDGYFRIWDTVSGKEIRKFGKPPGLKDGKVGPGKKGGGKGFVSNSNYNVTLSSDAKFLAELTRDGTVRMWDVDGGEEIRTFSAVPKMDNDVKGRVPGRGISSIALSPDGKVLATLGISEGIRLWDAGTGKEIHQIGKPPDKGKPRAVPLFIALRRGGNSLAFLADGKAIVSAGVELDDQKMQTAVLRIHDVDSGKELRRIKSEERFLMVSGLAILPESKTIAWAGRDGTIRLHDADSGKEIRKIGPEKQGPLVRTLLFSPDGKILATQTAGAAIQLWDVAGGKVLRTLGEGPMGISAPGLPGGGFGIAGRSDTIAFSRDGKTLAEATAGNTIRLWKVDTGKEIIPVSSGHHGGVSRLAVSSNGKVLTTFAGDKTIREWDMATGKELRQTKVPTNGIAFSGDGKLAAWSSVAKVTLWDVAGAKEIRTIDLPGQGAKVPIRVIGLNVAPSLSANGKWLAVRGLDQVLRVFDVTSGKELRALVERRDSPDPKGGISFIRALGGSPMGFSADGAALAAASANIGMGGFGGGGGVGMMPGSESLRLWNLTQHRNPRLFDSERKNILNLAVTPDGHNVVTANGDQTISVWEAVSGKECLQIKLPPSDTEKPLVQPLPVLPGGLGIIPRGSAFALAISPDGRTLAAGIDRQIHLFDLRTGKELGGFKGHQGTVVSLAFAPNNQTVVSGSADTTALVWDGSRFIKKPSTRDVPAEQVSDLWKDLAGDPVRAYQAIGTLSAAPKKAVALVREKVKAAAHRDEKRIAQSIADLESSEFQVRRAATKELEKLGELVEPALQKAMQTLKSLEAKRRVEKLLAQIADDQIPSADVLRALRAVQVLGQIGTPEARAELERLAKGAPGDKLTRSAETALKRLPAK